MTAPAASHPLLERQDELARLGDLIAAAAEGRGGALLLEGPAGIGKTSLLEAALRLAGDAGFGVLAARGGELERDFAYGVVRELFERRVLQASARERERALDGAAVLASPLLGLHQGDRPGDDPTAAVLRGLYWLTANLAQDGPLLIAVDDLHWVDSASLRFLAYLARRIAELPAFLIAATRPPLESDAQGLLEALTAARLEPAPLSRAAVRDLLALRGRAELADACHSATGGNPLLLGALLDALGDDVDAERLPAVGARSVMRLVARRLGRLGPDAAALARAVAVLGTDAEPRLRARPARPRQRRPGRARADRRRCPA